MNNIVMVGRPQWLRLAWRKEDLHLLFWLLVFFGSPQLFRLIDITAAPLDAGAFSAVILAIAAVLLFQSVTWWIIRTIWPAMAEYSRKRFNHDFNNLEVWQKIIVYLAFYLLLLYAFVLSFSAVL